jgi:molybdopterin converting factor small subunit
MNGRTVEVADDLAAVKAAVRELHELLQEAKEVKRQLHDEIEAGVVAVRELVDLAVEAQLARMAEATSEAVNEATARVNKRFDTLSDVLLGEDVKGRKKHGGLTLLDIAERVRDMRLASLEESG